MGINCVDLVLKSVYVDHCIGCDNIAPFDNNGHCWICGCDMPFGSIDDDELTQEMFESENIAIPYSILRNDRPVFNHL